MCFAYRNVIVIYSDNNNNIIVNESHTRGLDDRETVNTERKKKRV